MPRPGYHRLNIEYPRDALRLLTLYCSNGIGGLTPTTIMRMLLDEFNRQIATTLHEGATLRDVNTAIPLAVEIVKAKLERTGERANNP
jgi:hypothetical protein